MLGPPLPGDTTPGDEFLFESDAPRCELPLPSRFRPEFLLGAPVPTPKRCPRSSVARPSPLPSRHRQAHANEPTGARQDGGTDTSRTPDARKASVARSVAPSFSFAWEDDPAKGKDHALTALQIWQRVGQQKRLPRRRKRGRGKSKEPIGKSISAVVTTNSPGVTATLRPGMVQLSSAPPGSGETQLCVPPWKRTIRSELLPTTDIFDTQRRHGSCTVLWDDDDLSSAAVSTDAADILFVHGNTVTDVLFDLDNKAGRRLGGRVAVRVLGHVLSAEVLAGRVPPFLRQGYDRADATGGAAEDARPSLLLDVRGKEQAGGLDAAHDSIRSYRIGMLDPSLLAYRTALWDASGLTGSFGTPPACLSAPVATMLVATLMCHRVHVRRATSCKRSTDAARQAGEIAHATTAGGAFLADCALLASLKRAGVIDQVEM